jgi:uncharacterized membrane protein (UPF0127 family)
MTRIIGFLKVLIGGMALTLAGVSCSSGLKSDMPVAQLAIDGNKAEVEVANTEPTRMAGLMFRRDMGKNNGMIFVFSDVKPRAFWMKNTLIPLSIAFADDSGKIENILEMPPQTEQSFMSAGPARYALEMNAGWFSKLNIKPGDSIQGLTSVPASKD